MGFSFFQINSLIGKNLKFFFKYSLPSIQINFQNKRIFSTSIFKQKKLTFSSSSSSSLFERSNQSNQPLKINLKSFYFYIKQNNFYLAWQFYLQNLKFSTLPLQIKTRCLFSLLNLSITEEIYLEILEEFKVENILLSENLYLSLIRIYCSKNQPEKALETINQLISNQIPLKLRDFNPIFSFYCSSLSSIDTFHALNLVLSLSKYNLSPEPFHFIQLLKSAVTTQIITNFNFQQKIFELLNEITKIHYGFLYSQGIEIITILKNISITNNSENFPILIRKIDDVDGKVIIDKRKENSTVLVKYYLPPTSITYSLLDNSQNQEKNGSPTSYLPQIPIQRSELDSYLIQESLQENKENLTKSNATLCYISPIDSQCPNCNAYLREGMLNENITSFIRKILLKYEDIQVSKYILFDLLSSNS